MMIVGLDFSISAPGVVLLKCDADLNIESCKYKGYSSVMRTAAFDNNIQLYKKDYFDNDVRRFDFITTDVLNFITSNVVTDEEVWLAIEGYALGSTQGLVFNIAEATGMMKLKLWNAGYSIRIYDPNSIKKFATGKGNADKVMMGDSFIADQSSYKPVLPEALQDYSSPKADIVDAYWISKLLWTELMLRYGHISVKDLPLKTIEIFNQVSKANKDNLLVRDFITK